MRLENMLDKVKRVKRGVGRGIGYAALSLVTAFGAMGCGQEECQCPECPECPDVCYDEIGACGTYNMAFKTVEEIPPDALLPEEETGEFEMDVIRVNENKVKFYIFEEKVYDYNPQSGEVACKEWDKKEIYNITADYKVCGNIKGGNAGFDATVDVNYPEGNPFYPEGRKEHIKYLLEGTKILEWD